VVAAADVIIKVLDARDPLGSRCQDVERFVRQAGSDKKVILLLNKIGAPYSCWSFVDCAALCSTL
jgi:nuclear GTP-binding protein